MKSLDNFIKIPLVIIMITMSLVVALNVFCRFILNFSIYWADEVAQILLVWLTFLGAAVAVKDKSHYAMNFLIEKFNPKVSKWLKILRDFFSILAIGILFYYSLLVSVRIAPWVMPATEISRSWVYAAGPVGCLLMLWYSLIFIIKERKKEGGKT